jgi:hypothetical protein
VSQYTEDQIAILVRRRLGTDPAEALRYVPLIPAALLRTCRKAAARPSLRHHVWTDPASVTVALDGSGVADLSTLVATNRVQLDLLKYGEIRHADFPHPLRLVESSTAGFAGSLDSLFPKCFLRGLDLHTRANVEGVLFLTGTLAFAAPHWQTLAQLDESLVEMEGVGLVDSVIELLSLRPDEEDGD